MSGSSQVPADSPTPKAILTFSGLLNGSFTWTGPHDAHLIPPKYQPLLAAQPGTHPIDGGALGVTIIWDGARVSNHSFVSRVNDHTGDYQSSGSGGGVLFNDLHSFCLTFSKPVELPSLFWTYYGPTSCTGTITVFRHAADRVPSQVIHLHYPDSQGYVWHELTAFRRLPIERIIFETGDPTHDVGLNIDDITVVRAPASLPQK